MFIVPIKADGASWRLKVIVGPFLDGDKHGLRNVVPTLCAREVAASLALSNPSWMAVNTARSSSATISETLVLRKPRFSIICLACGIRESLGSPVSGSISHCERGACVMEERGGTRVCLHTCVCSGDVGAHKESSSVESFEIVDVSLDDMCREVN